VRYSERNEQGKQKAKKLPQNGQIGKAALAQLRENAIPGTFKGNIDDEAGRFGSIPSGAKKTLPTCNVFQAL